METEEQPPPGWVVWKNSVGWWIGSRLPDNPFTIELAAAGCTVGVIGYHGRNHALDLITGQESLAAAVRTASP